MSEEQFNKSARKNYSSSFFTSILRYILNALFVAAIIGCLSLSTATLQSSGNSNLQSDQTTTRNQNQQIKRLKEICSQVGTKQAGGIIIRGGSLAFESKKESENATPFKQWLDDSKPYTLKHKTENFILENFAICPDDNSHDNEYLFSSGDCKSKKCEITIFYSEGNAKAGKLEITSDPFTMENKKDGIFVPDKRTKFTNEKWDKSDDYKLIHKDLKITRIEAKAGLDSFKKDIDGICIVHIRYGR